MPTSSAQDAIYPIVPPDLERGAAIFAEKCVACHGERGGGNGPKVADLPVDVPAIGTSEIAWSARPVDWFEVVTNGRLERSMPPFSSLSDRDRWDVVAYTLALHTDREQLELAQKIYLLQCQSCHGPTGEGIAAQGVPDWTQPERLAQFSEEELFRVITDGTKDMPAFAEALDSGQRMTLAAYVRSLSFTSSDLDAAQASATTPGATEEAGAVALATPQPTDGLPERVTISGAVSAASGDAIPAGLDATLRAFDNMQLSFTQDAALDEDGRYNFKNVELAEGRVFLVTVRSQGVDFYSDVLHSSDLAGGQEAQLPITLYAVSNDISLLRGERLHVFFDFTDPQSVQVLELLIFDNPGDAVVASAEQGSALLNFKLPAGATNLQFEDGTLGDGTYIQTADGFGVAGVYSPAEDYQVLFAYNLPFERKDSLELELPIDVARAIVMVPASGVRVKSSQLEDTGETEMQGVKLRLYASTNLAANTPLKLTLSGRPSDGTELNLGSTSSLVLGGGTFMLVSLGAAIYLARRRKKEAAVDEAREEETPESLMDAIIALDDRRRSGELDEAAYLIRRSELKERLQQLLGEKDSE